MSDGVKDDALERAVRALLEGERDAYRALDVMSDDDLANVVGRYSGRTPASFAETLARLASAKLSARRSSDG